MVLAEGDLISLDCGAILDGWHGDSAITVGVGATDPKLLAMATAAEDAMWAGIAAAARGVASGRGWGWSLALIASSRVLRRYRTST